MIRVNRLLVPPPEELVELAGHELEEARRYYSAKGVPYSPFPAKAWRSPDVRRDLLELFQHKCAFCESPLSPASAAVIDHFRPHWIAVNLDGVITKPAYWWLASEWANLYPACPACNQAKAERFPVSGERARDDRGAILGSIRIDSRFLDLAFGDDSSVAYAATEEGRILRLDLPFRSRPVTDRLQPVSRIVVSANGERILGLDESDALRVFELFDGSSRSVLVGNEDITALSITPDGSQGFTGNSQGEIAIWSLQSDIQLSSRISAHQGRVNHISATPDGAYFVTVGEDDRAVVWDMKTRERLRSFTPARAGMAIMQDGRTAATQSGMDRLDVWDLETGERHFQIGAPFTTGGGLSASADGHFFTSRVSLRLVVLDGFARQWLTELAAPLKTSADGGLTHISPNGRYLLHQVSANEIRVISLNSSAAERALLLDPCLDDPEDFFVYEASGLVASIQQPQPSASQTSQPPDADRGRVTIDVFGLNRPDLVENRRRTAEELRDAVGRLPLSGSPDDPLLRDQLADLVRSDLPFTAMRRQLLPQFFQEFTNRALVDLPFVPDFLQKKLNRTLQQAGVSKAAFENLYKHAETRKSAGVEQTGSTDPFERSAQLARVEIKNFRCIKELSFDMGGGSTTRAGWKVLLGENGVGKSSILTAVTLAVMGQERYERLKDLDPAGLLRRGAKEGSVRVHFATDLEPVELKITGEGVEFLTRTTPRTYLLAFGSARWLPKRGALEPDDDRFVRVSNLFNPFIPLTDALPWLRDRKEERNNHRFRKIEAVIVRLLLHPEGTRILMREGVFRVVRPGQTVHSANRLDQLSDGYQTILAIAVSIMDMLGEKWKYEMEAADGLVLLDEIGSHLHPRWKLRIVESLRSAFPRMQFLASTHEPLCLRGLFNNEILLLRQLDDGSILGLDNLESPQQLSIDRLLTSPLFGLISTFRPEVEIEFNRYYRLLAVPVEKRSDAEKLELEALRTKLGEHGQLGDSAREQIAFEVVDELMAQRPPGEGLGLDDIKEETLERVAKLWANREETGG